MEQCLRVSPSLRQRTGDRAPSSHTGFSRSLLPSSTASSFLKVTVYLSTADIHIGPRLAFGKESKDRPDTAPPTSAASRTRLSRGPPTAPSPTCCPLTRKRVLSNASEAHLNGSWHVGYIHTSGKLLLFSLCPLNSFSSVLLLPL